MTYTEAVLLGLVQGIAEFFPISSSGHLAIVDRILGRTDPAENVAVAILLHLATLLAILVYFRREIVHVLARDHAVLGWIVLGSVPAAAVGFALRDAVGGLAASPAVVAMGLLLTGLFLLVSERAARRTGTPVPLGAIEGLLIGLAQATALVPGISRAGMTIGAGLVCGLDRMVAVRFAFLLGIPAIAGAGLLEAVGGGFATVDWAPASVAAATAFVAALGALAMLVPIVRAGRLHWFGFYCLLLSGGILVSIADG